MRKTGTFPRKSGPTFFYTFGRLCRAPAPVWGRFVLMLFFKFRGMQRKNKARIPPGCETVLIKITRPLPSAAPGFSDRLYSLCAAFFKRPSFFRLSSLFCFAPAQILPRILCRRRSFRPVSDSDTGPFFQKLRGEFSPNITAARQRPPALKLFEPPPPSLLSGSGPDRRGLRPIQRGAEHGRPFVRMICAALSLPVVGLLRGLRGSSRAAAAVAGFRERPRKGKPPAGALSDRRGAALIQEPGGACRRCAGCPSWVLCAGYEISAAFMVCPPRACARLFAGPRQKIYCGPRQKVP